MRYQYVGNLQGMQAVAVIELEQLSSYVALGGELTSQTGAYAFSADMYGDSGYGEMVDRLTGESFRIQVQNLTAMGFVLIVNPYEGLHPTQYVFQRSG